MKKLFSVLVCAALLAAPGTANGAETPKVYAYDQALALALKDLSGLATVKEAVALIDEQLDDLEKLPDTDEFRHAIKTVERQRESVQLNREIISAGTELSLRDTLAAIANYERDEKLLAERIALDGENLRRVTLRRQYGMVSDNGQRAAEQTLAQNRADLEALGLALAEQRQALNKLLQLPLDAEIRVEWKREIADPPKDIAAYSQAAVPSAPTIRQKKINMDMKKANLDFNKNVTKDDTKKLSLQSEYDQAVRELHDAKLALENVIRQGHQQREQLQTQRASLQVDAEKAADQYKTVQVYAAAGMVTQFEQDQAALAVAAAESAVEKNLNQLWVLQFGFTHPYLLELTDEGARR